ncbi:MAG: DUF4145 domain-containing protein [Candidatus Nanogingivalis sp.]
MDKKYYIPKYFGRSFNCPHCRVYSRQEWGYLRSRDLNDEDHDSYTEYDGPNFVDLNTGYEYPDSNTKYVGPDPLGDICLDDSFAVSRCDHCKEWVLWKDLKIIYPRSITVENPNPDMPEVAKGLYMESAKILQDSPRASAALLRLALQEILNEVVKGGVKNNINKNIGILSKEVDEDTWKAMDLIRIIGNNAVHPGEIQVEEENTEYMYNLLNIIVQKTISNKKHIDDRFKRLPKSIRESINRRSNKK